MRALRVGGEGEKSSVRGYNRAALRAVQTIPRREHRVKSTVDPIAHPVAASFQWQSIASAGPQILRPDQSV
jgi:hypothetical protein